MAGSTRKPSAKQEVAALQAEVEGATTGKIEFLGETFKVAEKVGIVPLLKLSAYEQDASAAGMGAAAAAMYAMLRDTIDPDDWDRFERHAIEAKASMEDLQGVVRTCVEILTARPTAPPAGSSSGPSADSPNSTGS